MMQTSTTSKYANIARPYASAVFEFAKEHQQLPVWKDFMSNAKLIASDEKIQKFLSNPEITSEKMSDLMFGIFQDINAPLSEAQRNFIKLLCESKRLILLPEIIAMFNDLYAQYEKISIVHVTTAVEMNPEFRTKLIASLKERENSDVVLQTEIDPAIIGGAIIHIGDKVIDGSIRGKLTRLLEFSLR